MQIPAWRVALTGGALAVLVAAAVGVAAAGTTAPDSSFEATADGLASIAVGGGEAVAPALERRLARHGRELVHGTVTIDDVDQGLITFQLDGGTIAAVDADSISVKEADGNTVTVAIDDRTWVRIDRHRAAAADLKAGREVYICSRIGESGAASARLIVVPPADAD